MVKMTSLEFYKIYIPALELALSNDDVNYGFLVKGPESYLNLSHYDLTLFECYLDEIGEKNDFIDKVAYYFDAISHGFLEIDGRSIVVYRNEIVIEMKRIKLKYNID